MSCGGFHNPIDYLVGGGGVKPNIIVMWPCAATAVPKGWAICNGKNGTPVLEGFTVKGAPGDKLYNSLYDNLTGYASIGQIGGASTNLATVSAAVAKTFTTGSQIQATFLGCTVNVTGHSLPLVQATTHVVTQPASHTGHTVLYNTHADHVVTQVGSHFNMVNEHVHNHGHSAVTQSTVQENAFAYQPVHTGPVPAANHTPESHPGFTVSGHAAHTAISFPHNDHAITVLDSTNGGHFNPNDPGGLFGFHFNSAGIAQGNYTPSGAVLITAAYTEGHSHQIDLRDSFRFLYFIMRL